MSLHKTLFASLLLTALSLAAAAPTYAGAVQLISPLGPGSVAVIFPGSGNVTLPSPLAVNANGTTVLFSTTGATFQRFVSDGATYDFAAGTALLDTLGNAPLIIDFAGGVVDVVLRAQGNFPGDDTFTLQAFEGATLLGTFSVMSLDGFASFIGVGATAGDVITRVVLSSTSSSGIGNDFSFGQVAITQTPEPATMILLGTGLAAVAAKFRRRRQHGDAVAK